MVIKGTINGGERFIRQSHNAIINLIPEPPRVKMVASQPGYLHSPATIACSVKSMTPFNVVWYFGEAREGTKWKPLTLPQLMSGRDVDSDVTYEITDVTDNSEGYYKCLIETSRGKDEGITYLDVEEQPPLIDAPDRLLVSPGQTAELKEPFKVPRSNRLRIRGKRFNRGQMGVEPG